MNPIMKLKEKYLKDSKRGEPGDKTPAQYLKEQMSDAIATGQLSTKTVQILPEIKLNPYEKFIGKINNHKSTFCVIGLLAGVVCTLIPYTNVFGKALFTTSMVGLTGTTIHREAKQSKFGPPGEFDLKAFLLYIFKLISDNFLSKK